MSTFKVIVTEGEIDVPGTGAFTADGVSGMGEVGIGILVVVLVVGTAIMGVMLRKRAVRSYDGRKGGFRIGDKGKKMGGLFSILLLVSALVVPLTMGGKNVEQVFAGPGDTELQITTPGDIELNLKKTQSGISGVYTTYVTVQSSTQDGYTVGIYASTADLLPTDSSIRTKFLGIDETGLTTLDDDRWGVSLVENPKKEDNVWSAVSTTKDNMLVLVDKDGSTTPNDVTYFSFGANVGSDMEVGTYSTTINYVATAKVNTEEP